MTQHLRRELATLTQHLTKLHNWPDPWPHRITLHHGTITRHIDNALANLAALAHTTPDHNPATTTQREHGDTPPTKVEAAANRLLHGPGRTVNELDTHITTANAHLAAGHNTNPTHQHTRGRHAWIELGNACTIVERWQTIDHEKRQLLLCNGLGLPGFFEWGKEECGQVAAASADGATNLAGLCTDCHRNRDAWRNRKNYRERTLVRTAR